MSTKIQWTNETWSPVTGCTKISAGCKNCWAKRMANRLRGRYGYPDDDPFRVTVRPDRLDQPSKWRKPRMVFVCSMSDLFHEDVPDSMLESVWQTAFDTPRHTYQILTKRPERMLDWISRSMYLSNAPQDNVWLGVTTENQACADERIPLLLQTPAAVRFVSVEPMLEAINLQSVVAVGESLYRCEVCEGSGIDPGEPRGIIRGGICPECSGIPPLDWVIIGCESGPGRRPFELDWARDLVDQCKTAGVPVFVKQLLIDGKVSHDPAEWPEDLRVREFPQESER